MLSIYVHVVHTADANTHAKLCLIAVWPLDYANMKPERIKSSDKQGFRHV